jgi:glycerate kinase
MSIPRSNRELRIILAPNSFRDCLTASEVAEAMCKGVQRVVSDAELLRMPMADGGDATLETMERFLPLRALTVKVSDPIGRPLRARYLLDDDGRTAIIEMAEASGLRLAPSGERDPWNATTYGTGELIRHALDAGARRILVGAGGSATVDGGAGALAALGAVFRNAAGRPLLPSPQGLASLARVDLSNLDPRLSKTSLTVLSDVSSPLKDNCRLFGPQKGIRPEEYERYDHSLKLLAVCAKAYGCDILHRPWCGAGGGLAGGLAAFAGARARGGAAFIARQIGLTKEMRRADLVFTGEGCLDQSSFKGKAPIMVSRLAAKHRVPSVILVGRVTQEAKKRIPATSSIFELGADLEPAESLLTEAPLMIADLSEQIIRAYVANREHKL